MVTYHEYNNPVCSVQKNGCAPYTGAHCTWQSMVYSVEKDLFKSLAHLKKYFVYLLFRERKGGKEGEKHQCVVTSRAPFAGDLAHNPGMRPKLGIKPVTP